LAEVAASGRRIAAAPQRQQLSAAIGSDSAFASFFYASRRAVACCRRQRLSPDMPRFRGCGRCFLVCFLQFSRYAYFAKRVSAAEEAALRDR